MHSHFRLELKDSIQSFLLAHSIYANDYDCIVVIYEISNLDVNYHHKLDANPQLNPLEVPHSEIDFCV